MQELSYAPSSMLQVSLVKYDQRRSGQVGEGASVPDVRYLS